MNPDQNIVNKVSIYDIDLDSLNNDELLSLQKEIDLIFKLREIISKRKDIMILALKEQMEKKKKIFITKMKKEIEEELAENESNEEDDKPVRATRRKAIIKKK
jgi:hypothetical protein